MADSKEGDDKPGILTQDTGKLEVDNLTKAIGKVVSYNKGKPLANFNLTYDAQTGQLEPIYYWLLDFIQDMGIDTRKITDNFTSSPGSGHFLDMEQRQSKMRQEAMTTLGGINQIIKSVINLLYDLKEFEMRLENYKDAHSKDKQKREAGILGLKQIWLDNVDIKRGNTSIKGMAFSQSSFATLIDAFMIVQDEKLRGGNEKELDLNDRVKRLLKQKIVEFNKWAELSEKELRKRYEIQRAYLKSQVESLKLYTAWTRPYLKAAEQLMMKGFEKNPALVNAFSTTMFELVLFGKKEYKQLPYGIKDYKMRRKYYSCFVVSFKYRGHVGQKVTQRGDYGFALGGRTDVGFKCYTLNDEELRLVEKELEKQDLEDSFKFIQESTDRSLEELKDEIEHFLEDDPYKDKEKDKKEDDINPFSAIWSLFQPMMKKSIKNKYISNIKELKKDNYVEKAVREFAGKNAQNLLYVIYDVYKKAHGMASSPEAFDM